MITIELSEEECRRMADALSLCDDVARGKFRHAEMSFSKARAHYGLNDLRLSSTWRLFNLFMELGTGVTRAQVRQACKELTRVFRQARVAEKGGTR